MVSSAASHSHDADKHGIGSTAPSRSPGGGVLPLGALPLVALPLGGRELPLLDGSVLQELEEELGQPEMAWDFANDYAAMWGRRQRCLLDSLEREDHAAALDAAISLKVSSAMVGGLRLAGLAEALETTLRKGDLRDGASLLAMISLHGYATVKELQLRYVQAAGRRR